ncbi:MULTISPECIES: cytochrome ubiquinol oxidase subunit I [Mesobacillus]|uniref:Cytochrome C n=2 Tax=Mesobacillus TaxID=2675231 RepID=A0A0D6ZEV1_9BACI|nr:MULTISPECIES: cytochrome ubiquinol oxidase subunit I [Mesobacillus]KIY23780.1 cytochrome C [Mesobacillus subterraneus]MDQ0413342.1 mono/diheme cytochrome c family protein [Mesobacillus stamsii]
MEDIIGFYPLWYVPNFGSNNILAITAVVHVLFSHMSVGASFLLAYLATKSYREKKPEIMLYVKKYIFTLLITSYVIGSITGPGIWFATTVASPRGISALIHNFGWVWAAEWVWFVTEVIIIYVLYYIINKIDAKSYMRLTWMFAAASFMTLLAIVGILSFMLSPGGDAWFTSGSAMDAFYNLNYFPHAFMRASYMFALAALMGIVISTRLENQELKSSIYRVMSMWGIGGITFGTLFYLLYIQTVPQRSSEILDYAITDIFKTSLFSMVIVTITFFIITYITSKRVKRATPAILMLLFVLALALYPEEKIRETIRKPFVVGEFMWSNQIIARDIPAKKVKSEVETIDKNGLLSVNPFVPESMKTIEADNKVDAGRTVALLQCSACHSVEPNGARSLTKKIETLTDEKIIYDFLEARLSGHPELGGAAYMPKLVGTEEEKQALAAFLADVNKKRLAEESQKAQN